MPAPANDLCAAATVIASLPHSETGLDSTSATTTAGENSAWAGDGTFAGATQMYRTMWWSYTPGSNQRVKFLLSSSSLIVAVYTGSCGALVEVVSNRQVVTIDLVSGTTYRIAVGWYTDTGAAFDFSAAVTTDPGNQSQQTAIDITTLLPYAATFDGTNADDYTASFDFSLYFKYVGQPNELLISFLAYASTFVASVRVYSGPADIFDGNVASPDIFTNNNEAMQYPIADGTTYYFRVSRASGTVGFVAVSARRAPNESNIDGGILVTSDSVAIGFPATVIDRATGELIRALNVPAGEWGDILTGGNYLVDDIDNDKLLLFSYPDTVLVDVGTLGFDPATFEHKIRLSPSLQEFFIGRAGGGGNNASIHRVSAAGVPGTAWTLASAGLLALAPNNDGSIVYVSTTSAAVKRLSTVGSGSFLSDLIASPGVGWVTHDMLVLLDNTIIVLWTNSTQAMVKSIAPDGTVLNTLTQSLDDNGRLAYDPDSYASHFWLWRQTGDGLENSIFQRIELATLTVVETVPTVRNFSHGLRMGDPEEDPERFGINPSCPFLFLRAASDDDYPDIFIAAGIPGPYTWVHVPVRQG